MEWNSENNISGFRDLTKRLAGNAKASNRFKLNGPNFV